jgi:hypothetical protein
LLRAAAASVKHLTVAPFHQVLLQLKSKGDTFVSPTFFGNELQLGVKFSKPIFDKQMQKVHAQHRISQLGLRFHFITVEGL